MVRIQSRIYVYDVSGFIELLTWNWQLSEILNRNWCGVRLSRLSWCTYTMIEMKNSIVKSTRVWSECDYAPAQSVADQISNGSSFIAHCIEIGLSCKMAVLGFQLESSNRIDSMYVRRIFLDRRSTIAAANGTDGMNRMNGHWASSRWQTSDAAVAQKQSNSDVCFNDHKAAYGHLNHGEVLRAWFVLKLCSWDFAIQSRLKVSQ